MSDIELAVKLRDAFQMAADACDEYLEKRAPASVKFSEKDFDKLAWTTKEGSKGPYHQTTKKANNNNEVFQGLQEILRDHKGFWQTKKHSYWFHQNDQDTIDRRSKG